MTISEECINGNCAGCPDLRRIYRREIALHNRRICECTCHQPKVKEMMTKSRQLVADAVGELDCTEQERAEIREHMKDNDFNGIHYPWAARMVAEEYRQMLRDITAEEAVQPKWTRLHHSSEGCKASCCTSLAMWEIWVEAVPGIMFNLKACARHAGKEDSE